MANVLPVKEILISLSVLLAGLNVGSAAYAQDQTCLPAPPLPAPDNLTVTVRSVAELTKAIIELRANTTILIQPGQYKLQNAIAITADDVTIRGASDDCSAVVITGPGMENRNYGRVDNAFFINAKNTTIANLTVGEVYFHTVQINATAESPRIYNVRMFNSGQQFVKSNPIDFGNGVDHGIVEYSIMEYTDHPPKTDHNGAGTGYTNGVDIHAGTGWRISNNLFRNFHTPDNADFLWNPAVLVFRGASDTITENNVFIDVDRAIAYGLADNGHDHTGGIIRNNMVVMTPGLYSKSRASKADAPIVVWDSPGTKVLHNSILTSGNTPLSIELRFGSDNVEVANNIADAPVSHRDSKLFLASNNIATARPNWFMNPAIGNLRLRPEHGAKTGKVKRHPSAILDVDQQQRPIDATDIGAAESQPLSQ